MSASRMRVLAGAVAACLLSAGTALAQGAPAPAPAPAQAPASAPQNAPVFSQEELDQILAPIALYPDQLLAQIFMAATYPLEIVEADRWLKQGNNAKLKGDDLANALQSQPWDPSVKSLIPFPQVLDMMSQQLSWTQKLGDAMLAQESDVMASVQRLRQKAQSSGSLQSNQQQTVSTEGQTIIIQPANPETVYVPVYQPTQVYGTWPYPSYPPYYYPPSPYYPIATPFLSGMAFAAGVAVVGSMWGWGNCNWGGGNVNINNNVYNNINRGNINAGRAQQLPAGAGAGGRGNWQHNPQHRGGVAYRDQGSRQNYGRASTGSGQNFRGRDGGAGRPGQGAGAGRPGQGAGAGAGRPGQGAGAGAGRPGQGAGAGANRPSQGAGANRPSQGAGANRPSQGGARPSQGAMGGGQGGARPSQGAGAGSRPSAGPSAFGGMGNGRSAGAQSNRGASSRSFSGGGGARGGGGSRGGGGGRGGGRR